MFRAKTVCLLHIQVPEPGTKPDTVVEILFLWRCPDFTGWAALEGE